MAATAFAEIDSEFVPTIVAVAAVNRAIGDAIADCAEHHSCFGFVCCAAIGVVPKLMKSATGATTHVVVSAMDYLIFQWHTMNLGTFAIDSNLERNDK